MRAENAIRFRVRNKLDHSIDIFIAERAAVGPERKLSNAIIDPHFLRLVFGHADACKFGIRVNDSGNCIVVHVARFTRNYLHAGDPFVFRFMREHRAGSHIADCVNALNVCPEMFVHFDALPVIEFDTNFLCADSFGKRTAPNRDKDLVGVELHLFAAFGCRRRCATIVDLDRTYLRFQVKRYALSS